MLKAFIEQRKLPEEFKLTAEDNYKPLAERIFRRYKKTNGPYFVGINGCQGSGKSTFTDYIAEHLTAQYQLNIVVMSLDDFYLSREKRNQLAHNIHPLLATRGVPGTHDVATLNHILRQLSSKQTGFAIPRFNKATDEPFAEAQWTVIAQTVDIVLVEGWCWGIKAQSNEQLTVPVNALELDHDSHGVWRNYVNLQLKNYYQPLYENMDYWIAIQAPSFDCVYQWRLEQEQKLADKIAEVDNSSDSSNDSLKVMNPAQVLAFVQYFQRLTVQGINTLSQSADATLHLDQARKITKMIVKDER